MNPEEGSVVMDAITVKYTRASMLQATTCFWKRFFGLKGLAVLVALWVCVGLLWTVAPHDWLTIALLTSAVLIQVLGVGAYFGYRHRVLAYLARLDDGVVEYRFDEEGLGWSSNLGASTLKWATFERLWKFPDVWLLFISKQQYIVLPVDQLPSDALDLVDSRVAGHR
jgi:hypothetical protein